MALSTDTRWGNFTGSTLSAADINDRVAALEEYINGNIVSSDLNQSRWVGHRHIDAADFYGSPAPRWEGVSQTVHHRYTSNRKEDSALFLDDVAPNKFVTIYGLACRVRVHPQVTRTPGLEVAATWYTFEDGGSANYDSSTHETSTELCAQFALFIDGEQKAGTLRELFYSSGGQRPGARKHHSVNYFLPDIAEGVHDVCIMVQVPESDEQQSGGAFDRKHKFIWVRARTMTAKVIYL